MSFRRLQAVIGYAVVPILLVLPFLFTHASPLSENYSGMMADPSKALPFYLSCMPALVYLLAVLWKLGNEIYGKKWDLQCLTLMILILLIILIQYDEGKSILSSFHVLLGFLAFIDLNWMLYQTLWLYSSLRIPYFCGLILAFLESVTFDSINGLAEIIYGMTLTLTLTHACIKKGMPEALLFIHNSQ